MVPRLSPLGWFRDHSIDIFESGKIAHVRFLKAWARERAKSVVIRDEWLFVKVSRSCAWISESGFLEFALREKSREERFVKLSLLSRPAFASKCLSGMAAFWLDRASRAPSSASAEGWLGAIVSPRLSSGAPGGGGPGGEAHFVKRAVESSFISFHSLPVSRAMQQA